MTQVLVRGKRNGLPVTEYAEFNSAVEFDCPFEVFSDGSITNDVPNVYAPEVYDEDIHSDEWEFFSAGYTGQYAYNGPIMHASEQLSGRLARDILDTPGIYVVVASEALCDDECWDEDAGECLVYGDHEPYGWAVLRLTD